MVLPTRAMAALVAAEWAAQQGTVKPDTMPATRAANAAIDKTGPHRAQVAAEVAGYGATDLVCYRAEGPAALVARQAAAWDPILGWLARRYGVGLVCTTGVMPAAQPGPALARLAAEVAGFDPFRLTALHDLVALPGSLAIGLAAAERAFDRAALWAAARIDEDWQIAHWGTDPEAEAAAANRRAAFFQAATVFDACTTGTVADSQA
jgi:chaperone required for assembly of F1-ATPase